MDAPEPWSFVGEHHREDPAVSQVWIPTMVLIHIQLSVLNCNLTLVGLGGGTLNVVSGVRDTP